MTAKDDLMESIWESLSKFIYDTNWLDEICTQIDLDLKKHRNLNEYLKKDYFEED